MIPGSDRTPRQRKADCTTCRVMGFSILTGTGLYTIYSALYASEPSSTNTNTNTNATAGSGSSGQGARTTSSAHSAAGKTTKSVVLPDHHPRPSSAPSLGLGLNTTGFGRHAGFGRGIMAGFGVLLVAAGISRGMGVTHHDVVDFKNRILGKNQQPPEPINVDGDTNNEPKALPSDL